MARTEKKLPESRIWNAKQVAAGCTHEQIKAITGHKTDAGTTAQLFVSFCEVRP